MCVVHFEGLNSVLIFDTKYFRRICDEIKPERSVSLETLLFDFKTTAKSNLTLVSEIDNHIIGQKNNGLWPFRSLNRSFENFLPEILFWIKP